MDNLEIHLESEYNTGPLNLLRGERGMLLKTLNKTKTIKAASKILGVVEKSMYRKIIKHQIETRENVRRGGYPFYYIESLEPKTA